MLPFSHALLDDDGEVIRKFRWSTREAIWFKTRHPHWNVVQLPKEKKVKLDLFKLVGECLF